MEIPYKKIKRIVSDVMGPGISDVVPLKKGMTNNSMEEAGMFFG